MDIKCYPMGPLATNTYFLFSGDSALIIDPAGKFEKVKAILEDKKLLAILLTHGHFDHIKTVDELKEFYKCPVLLGKDDDKMAHDKLQGHEFGIYNFITCETVDVDDKAYEFGPFNFEVIHTPGHTEGSVIYVFENEIFSGDTLFKNSVGRTDLEGGSAKKLKESLKIFKEFKKDYKIYPGHEESSLLSEELKYNPFLN